MSNGQMKKRGDEVFFPTMGCMKEQQLPFALGLLAMVVCPTNVLAELCQCASSNFVVSFVSAPTNQENATCSKNLTDSATRCTFHYKSCTGSCNRKSNFENRATFNEWVRNQQQTLENFDCTNKTESCPLYPTAQCTKCPVSFE
jgi:hypothetical protein